MVEGAKEVAEVDVLAEVDDLLLSSSGDESEDETQQTKIGEGVKQTKRPFIILPKFSLKRMGRPQNRGKKGEIQ